MWYSIVSYSHRALYYILLPCAQSGPTLRDPVIVAHEAPLSMEFSRQEYWSGLPVPIPGDHPYPEIEPALLCLLHWQADFHHCATWEAHIISWSGGWVKWWIVKRNWLLGIRYITSLGLNYLMPGSQYLLTTFTISHISYSPLWQWPEFSVSMSLGL